MNEDIATPYTAVYLIFKKDDKYALVLRTNTHWMNGHYCLPSGRVEKNESFHKAAIREGKEEAGVDFTADNLKLVITSHRTHPDSTWVDTVFEVTDWEGEIFNAEPDVHGELIWRAADDLPENMVPGSKLFIEKYISGENYVEQGWDV